MKKFTISYGALHKSANLEIHRDDKFLVFRKQLNNVSMDEVIATASNVFSNHNENDIIIFFNGTPSDFTKLQRSMLAKKAMSIYHVDKYENLENRLELVKLLYIEIQNGPYPLSEDQESEFIKRLEDLDLLGTGYCLLEHLWSQHRLNVELLDSNNFSAQFTDMLDHYLSWLDELLQRLDKLLD